MKKTFWVTNINQRMDVRIDDLNIVIRAGTSVDLLNMKGVGTIDELEESQNNGSIFQKSKWIKVRKVPPQKNLGPQRTINEIPVKAGHMLRSQMENTVERFEDLDDMGFEPDEVYADQMADLDLLDAEGSFKEFEEPEDE